MADVPSVLLVEEDDNQRNRLALVLTTCGYRVLACKSYDEAYQSLDTEHPNVLITDVHLRGRSGLQLAHIVARRYPDVKRILLTAFDDIELRREAARTGTRFLLKPLKTAELEAVLEATRS